jgi:2-keto-4-pentenoate hydratase
MRSAEPEFAFRIAHDLDGTNGPITRDDAVAAVVAVHPAIEVPDSRFADYAAISVPQLVADALCAAFVVLGRERNEFVPASLARQQVVMYRNGEVVAEGSGAAVLGDPLRALTWLANELATRGSPLARGDLVITGTCAPPTAISPGDDLFAHFGQFGSVAVSFKEEPSA